jgi:hypothetical protein
MCSFCHVTPVKRLNAIYCTPCCAHSGSRINPIPVEHRCLRSSCTNTTFNPKYCSKSCSAIETNHNSPRRKRTTFHCSCGTAISNQSNSCRKCRRKSDFESWLNGENIKSTPGFSPVMRSWFLERSNFHCEDPNCAIPGGWSIPHPLTGKPPLELDHIDGVRTNNRITNGMVRCPCCHALQPTDRFFNSKYARAARAGDANAMLAFGRLTQAGKKKAKPIDCVQIGKTDRRYM